jgi:hypothetical protein
MNQWFHVYAHVHSLSTQSHFSYVQNLHVRWQTDIKTFFFSGAYSLFKIFMKLGMMDELNKLIRDGSAKGALSNFTHNNFTVIMPVIRALAPDLRKKGMFQACCSRITYQPWYNHIACSIVSKYYSANSGPMMTAHHTL